MNESRCNEYLWGILSSPDFRKFHGLFEFVRPKEPVSEASIVEIISGNTHNTDNGAKDRIKIPIFCCKASDTFFQPLNDRDNGVIESGGSVGGGTTTREDEGISSHPKTFSKAQYTFPPSTLRIHYDFFPSVLLDASIDSDATNARRDGQAEILFADLRDESLGDLRNTIKHELVHAVDHRILGIDMQSCGGLACSEVRASSVAECAKYPINSWRRRECTKYYSKLSSEMSFPIHGRKCVMKIFSACYDPSNVDRADGVNDPSTLDKFYSIMKADLRPSMPPQL
jgi:hypothetical protein